MSADVLIAAVGTGKTRFAAAEVLREAAGSDAGKPQRIWVILPSSRQEDAFRQRLIESAARPVLFNIHLFSFYKLYQHVLDAAGQPQRELDRGARLRLLGSLLEDLHHKEQLPLFGAVAHTPGFAQIAADLIYELKQNQVQPKQFSDAASSSKDRELALIYTTYQETLQHYKLVDREGEGWLALEFLRKHSLPGETIGLLVVDGFDQFNPLQAELLAVLAQHAGRTLITLPTVPERERSIGRRFQQAYARLQQAFAAAGVELRKTTLPESNTTPTPLRHLANQIFRPDPQPCPSEGCVRLIEVPDPVTEAGALMRQVKHLLLKGVQPDDILIAVRDWGHYGQALAGAAQRYGVPAALHYGDPLLNNPALIALMNVLELAEADFPRRALLDALRSDYFTIPDLNEALVKQIDRVSRDQIVSGGRALWSEALTTAETAVHGEDDENEPQKAETPPVDTRAARAALERFFEAVTPPARATTADYIRWIESLTGADALQNPDDVDEETEDSSPPGYTLGMLQRIREPVPGAITNRDLGALRDFKRALHSLYTAHRLLAALHAGQPETKSWRVFLGELKAALLSAEPSRAFNRAGRVLVTSVADARGLPHAHILLPGLCEGMFPPPTPEDPLYLDSERLRLQARGLRLETAADRAADEGIFYELIGQARETLILSRSTIQNGAPWPASHLWRAVTRVFSDSVERIAAQRIAPGATLPAEECALPAEAALVTAAALNEPSLSAGALPLYNWLTGAEPDLWSRVRRGRQVETERMQPRQRGPYAGRLTDQRLLDAVRDRLGATYVWSASQLNEQATCGFRFFAKRMLGLEAWKEPEVGTDQLQLGSLNHDLLEQTYRAIQEQGLTIGPDHAETAVSMLHECAPKLFASAPTRFGFRPSARWEQEKLRILKQLEAFIRLDFSADSPAAQLLPQAPRQPLVIEGALPQEGVPLNLPDGTVIRLRGKIDRIDAAEERALVIDYKTGSTRINPKDMARGRNFQMVVYLQAGESLLQRLSPSGQDIRLTGGLFWHLHDGTISTPLQVDDAESQEHLDSAYRRLAEQINRSRGGDFGAEANGMQDGKCYSHCDFARMCRISNLHQGGDEA